MQKFLKNINLITLVFSMCVVTFLGLVLLGQKEFSMDELDTIFITKDWATMISIIHDREGNMWLYYLLVYFWQTMGHSEAIVRSFSVLFAVLAIPVTYLLGKTLFNPKVARITVLLLSVNIFLIFNAQNARSYALELFLTTLSTYFFAEYILQGGRKKYLFATTAINILAVYTHLFALLIIGAQFLSLLMLPQKKILPKALPAFILSGLFLLPLFLAPSIHSQQINWIQGPTLRNLIGTFLILSNDFPPIAFLYICLLICYFVIYLKRWTEFKFSLHTWRYGLILLQVIFPITAAFLFSIFIKPLYISAYFFISLVPFTLLIALSFESIKRIWLRNLIFGIVIVLAIIRLMGWYTGNQKLELVIPDNNEKWKETSQYLVAQTKPTDAVLFFPSMVEDKVNYYQVQQNNKQISHQIILQPNFLTTGKRVNTLDLDTLSSLQDNYTRVWFVWEKVTGKETDAQTNIIKNYLEQHYSLKNIKNLDYLTVYKYEK